MGDKERQIFDMFLLLWGKLGDVTELWKRIRAGEDIPDEEILDNQKKINAAVNAWDNV